MGIQSVIDNIDLYGSNLKRWPDDAAAEYKALKDESAVKDAMADAREIDDLLSEWQESDDGAEIQDDANPGEPGEGGSDPGVSDESPLGELLGGSGVPDMDGMLSAALGKMALAELSSQKYVQFTRDHDRIEVMKASPDADVPAVEAMIGTSATVMAKDLQRLITARSLATMQPGLRRGKINPSSLHRMEVGDDRVFRKRIEGQSKDVAVSLLVDCSGSMYGGQFQIAVASAWAFAEVLDGLGIKCEVLGFTTHYYDSSDWGHGGKVGKIREEAHEFARSIGRSSYEEVRWEPLYMPIWKTFDERFGLEQKRRMATSYGYDWQEGNLRQNLDGECVLEAAKRLKAQRANRHLLMVFSDGQPCAGTNGRLLQTHLKESVKTVSGWGVETVGIGICDDSVSDYYPNHFSVYNVNELPARVIGELKKFLAG